MFSFEISNLSYDIFLVVNNVLSTNVPQQMQRFPASTNTQQNQQYMQNSWPIQQSSNLNIRPPYMQNPEYLPLESNISANNNRLPYNVPQSIGQPSYQNQSYLNIQPRQQYSFQNQLPENAMQSLLPRNYFMPSTSHGAQTYNVPNAGIQLQQQQNIDQQIVEQMPFLTQGMQQEPKPGPSLRRICMINNNNLGQHRKYGTTTNSLSPTNNLNS